MKEVLNILTTSEILSLNVLGLTGSL